MSMPLSQPFVPTTDFEKFIEEIGLGLLPQEAKDKMALQASEMAAYAVVKNMARRLSDEKQDELDRLTEEAEETGNQIPVNQFLLKEIPDLDNIVNESVGEVKEMIRLSMRNVPKNVDEYMSDFKKTIDRLAKEHASELAMPTEAPSTASPTSVNDFPPTPAPPAVPMNDGTVSSPDGPANKTGEEAEGDSPFPWEQNDDLPDEIARDESIIFPQGTTSNNDQAQNSNEDKFKSDSEEAMKAELDALSNGNNGTDARSSDI